jgi:hypothetical protein
MDLTNLDSIGYVYIPNFLSATELKLLNSEYQHSEVTENKNYSLVHSKIAKKILGKKIKDIMNAVNEQTSLHVDHITPTVNYMDTENLFFDWHQDHESYYVYQQSKNHLNFYMPVIKPDSTKSGVSVVPMDRLHEYLTTPQPERIIDSGAKRFKLHSNYTEVFDDENGKGFKIPVNLDHIAESPELHAGDLLLIRGDVIHKTQDASTHRVAISVRVIDGTAPVSLKRLTSGCEEKMKFIKRNQPYYDKIIELFEKNKKNKILASDIDKGSNNWKF